MTTKIKSLDDCVTGRDYIEFAQAQEWNIEPNGSYQTIYDKDGNFVTNVANTGRCFPKETRKSINTALIKAGLLGLMLAVIMAWVM